MNIWQIANPKYYYSENVFKYSYSEIFHTSKALHFMVFNGQRKNNDQFGVTEMNINVNYLITKVK
jgi:hypothetical protein